MNITKLAQQYLFEHPSIRSCLQKGLINYSSLSRMIAKSHNISSRKHFDALLIACRRYKQKLKEKNNEGEIRKLLSESKIEAKTKICTLVLEREASFAKIEILESEIRKAKEVFRLVEGASAITLIISEEFLARAKALFSHWVKHINTQLVEVTLKTSPKIEETPGVVAYIYSLLAEHRINMIESLSCWIDTIMIVDEKDLAKVMELLRF